MRKLLRRVGICLLLAALVWCGTVLADREALNQELIRFHVVANSDSNADQNVKLRVRDAVLASLRDDLANIADVEEARAYLQANLPKIQAVANQTLKAAGCDCEAVAMLCRETFDTRYYDTFTLPAGVYEALRITIGAGEGHNWWCVAFPALCLGATSEGFEAEAAGAGFPDSLTGALAGNSEYEIRFFLLDALGRLENLLFFE